MSQNLIKILNSELGKEVLLNHIKHLRKEFDGNKEWWQETCQYSDLCLSRTPVNEKLLNRIKDVLQPYMDTLPEEMRNNRFYDDLYYTVSQKDHIELHSDLIAILIAEAYRNIGFSKLLEPLIDNRIKQNELGAWVFYMETDGMLDQYTTKIIFYRILTREEYTNDPTAAQILEYLKTL